jgi:hypothetical protein
MSRPLTTEEQNIIYLLKKDAPYRDFFFVRAKSLKWLEVLRDEFINSKTIDFDKEGNTLFWPPLDYLEKVATAVEQNPTEYKGYAIELLNIIDEVVNFSISQQEQGKKPINHYHVWWYFVKILNKIPNELIRESGIGRFKKWIKEFTNQHMRGEIAVEDILRLLLPKFLYHETNEYAGEIIKTVTRIKPSEKKKTFIKHEDAKLAWSAFWLLDFFNKHAKKVGEVCDGLVVGELMDTLCRALEYHTREQFCVFKIEGAYYRATFSRVDKKDTENINYQEGEFHGIAQKYTEQQLQTMNPENGYDIYHNDPTGEQYKFEIKKAKDYASFEEAFQNCCKNELKALNLNKAEDFGKTIGYLYKSFFEDYSYIWYSSLERPTDCHADGAHEALSIILKDVFTGKCASSQKEGEQLIKTILQSERYNFSIFGRLVLLTINKEWDTYKHFLEEFMKTHPLFLEESNYRTELLKLFKNHAREFSSKIVTELKGKLDSPSWYTQGEDDKAYYYWRYEIVTMLKDVEIFQADYEKLKEQFKDIPEPTGERRERHSGFIKHKSPLLKEEILQLPVIEIVKYLKEYDGAKNIWEIMDGKPDRGGLADELQAAVKEKPDHFVKDIELMHDAPLRHSIALVRGLQEAWQDHKAFDWGKTLEFCEKYIPTHKDLKESKVNDLDYSRTGKEFGEATARLIEIGSTDDKNAFENSLIEKANQIFEVIFEAFSFEEKDRMDRSPMSFALNSFAGRIIYPFFIFSLHVKRVSPEHEIVQNWGTQKYDRFLSNKNSILQAIAFLGRFLPKMWVLDNEDRSWIIK